MRRSILAASLVAAAAVLAACGDKPLPTSPEVAGPPASRLTISVDGCVAGSGLIYAGVNTDVSRLIIDLFSGDHEQSTLSMWDNIKKDKLDGRPLQNHIDNLAKWTLEQLSLGGLTDPDGAGLLNATTGSVRMLDLVFRCTGEVPTQLPAPPAGFDALFQMVDQSDADQQFLTSFLDALGFVPGGALSGRTMLVMVRQPAEVQVNTPFPKLSHTIDVALAGGKLNLNQRLSILFCPIDENLPSAVNARAVIAHQRTAAAVTEPPSGEGVVYLDPPVGVTVDELDCHNVQTAWRLEKGFLRQRAMQVASFAKRAWGFIGPKPLYAGHAAIGGSLGGFGSPMVAVDPFVGTEIIIGTIPTTTYGEAVSFNATLRITSGPASWIGLPVTQSIVGMPALTLSALQLTAALDGQSQTQSLNDGTDDGIVHFSFTGVNAGADQNATVSFDTTNNLPANAPLFGGSTASRTFTVNPRPLSVTAQAETWIYGTPEPVTGTFTADQVQYGEPVTPVFSTLQNALTNVGTYPGALVADVNFGGARAENYVVTRTNATLTVDPAPLDISANDKTREYGLANPVFDGTIGDPGIKNGDDITLTFATAATIMSEVGNYPIVPTAVGERLFNYFIRTTTNGTLTITPAPLVLTIQDASKTYGDANPEFAAVPLAGRNGDALTIAFATTAQQLSAVGTYPILGRVRGDRAANYTVTPTGGTLTVNTRALTGEIDDKTKVQGTANPPLTGSVTNTAAGDGFVVLYVTTATTGSAVGDYPITVDLSGAGGSNYTWNTANDGTLTVTPSEVLYGVESSSDGLSVINPSTGAATFVNRLDPDVTRFTTPVALSTDATTGTLYAWNNSNGNTNETQVITGVLLTVNACTGRATQVSAEPSGVIGQALAVSPAGVVYLLSSSLYQVNKTTGALTAIAPLTVDVKGADFDPVTGVLYALSETTLYTINTTTGAATVVATLNAGVGTIGSLVFTSDGVLIGSGFGVNSILFDVDKATGAVSNARGVSGAFAPQGMGFAAACSGG